MKPLISVIFYYLLASCATTVDYNKGASFKNAELKVQNIKSLVKKAENEKKNSIAFKAKKASGCSYHVKSFRPNDNLEGQSNSDFQEVLKREFLVLRTVHSRDRAIAYYRNAWTTRYILGDGSIILTHKIDLDNGFFKSKCPSSSRKVEFTERIYISTNNDDEVLTSASLLNRDPSKVNEEKFVKISKSLDYWKRNSENEAEEQRNKRIHYSRVSAEKKARRRELQKQKDAQHFLELKNKINQNMKFFSGNTQYIEQQNKINKKNYYKPKKYQSRNSYTPKKRVVINNIHQAYYQNAVLTARKSLDQNGVNYYSNVSKIKWPTLKFEDCGEKFTPVVDLETQYRKECTERFGNAESVVKQCLNQGGAKARDTFLQKYGTWFGRQCPQAPSKNPTKFDKEA